MPTNIAPAPVHNLKAIVTLMLLERRACIISKRDKEKVNAGAVLAACVVGTR
jgi:hypothetical protein